MAGRFSIEAVFKGVDRLTAPVSRMQNRVGKFTRAMTRGLRTANRALSNVIGGLKRGAGTALKFATIGIGTLTASVGLLVREFSKVEDAQAAFTPLLGGAKKAKELVDELNKTAASTPFQFENLAGTASQLLPVMNGDIQNTIKTLRMMGDTAGGNAQKLDSITRGFTKAMLKGKVDMESLNMIGEAGVPIFTELADSMGTKVNAAFFKMISAGKVTTRDLTKAFEKMTSKGGVFFKGMEISSKTTSGMFSTLKDNISLTAAELGGVLAPTVKDLIKGATGIAKRVREWVKNNKELINKKFLAFVDSMKRGFNGLITMFDFLQRHGKTIAIVIGAIVGLSLALKTLIGILTLVNLVMAANPVTLIVIGVVALIAAFAALVIWIDDIIIGFENMNPAIRLALAPLELILRTIKAIKDVGGFLGGGLGKFIANVTNDTDFIDHSKEKGSSGSNVVSPQDRLARTIEEQRTTSTAEVTIRDESGRAAVTGGKLGLGITLQPSGAF